MTGVLVRRENRDTQRECLVTKSADRRDAAASHRLPRTDGHYQKLEEARKDFPRSRREHEPAGALISDS